MAPDSEPSPAPELSAVFDSRELAVWAAARPATFPSANTPTPDDLQHDAAAAAGYFKQGEALLGRLVPPAQRSDAEKAAAAALHAALRSTRLAFLRTYTDELYAQITADYSRFVQPETLVYKFAERCPGLAPAPAAIDTDHARALKDKEQLERDQALVLWQVLSRPRAGAHLVHAMMRPRDDSLERLEHFRRTGVADFGVISLHRRGRAGHLTLANTRYLNAEDATTLPALETCIDLVLLDPDIDVGILRGEIVDHPRYRGRRIFSAGLNLTHLYEGKIPFMFFVRRDVGMVSKLYRGLTGPAWFPDEPEDTLEKPWIAAVDGFAIGGGCQLLLVMDKVIAEQDAYFTLPARREGIIPGTANLRLPRIVGDRLARQGIQFDYRFRADSPEGSMLCDTIVPAAQMDEALEKAIADITTSGVVSFASNRKALRVGQEPLPVFQRYAATFVKELADCCFSPALVRNLELHWRSKQRGD